MLRFGVMIPKLRARSVLLSVAALLWAGLAGGGCQKPAPVVAQADSGKPAPAAAQSLEANRDYVLVLTQHETIGDASGGLMAALKLPVDLPLPYPRVERRGDRFRVVAGRGKGTELTAVEAALRKAGAAVTAEPHTAGGGDDVVRLGIVCTDGSPVPLYAAPLPKSGTPRELRRLPHGQVVVPTEDDDEPGGEGEPGAAAERGFVKVLRPAIGLLHGPDALFPADCTPRDEDNDDGNGRLLAGGRLCLTTRHSGDPGPGAGQGAAQGATQTRSQIPRADLLAVSPSYRRCLRVPGAGTFDGFDHNQAGTQFAVEHELPKNPAAGAPPHAGSLRIYSVSERGEPVPRGEIPDLIRPAYLGSALVAVRDAGASSAPELVALDDLGARAPSDASPLPAPRVLYAFPPQGFVRMVPKATLYRPAAPTLHDGRVHATFQLGCRPDADKRVRAAARRNYVQCLMEVNLEVGLDGSRPERRCRLDNVDNGLDEPLPTPCP